MVVASWMIQYYVKTIMAILEQPGLPCFSNNTQAESWYCFPHKHFSPVSHRLPYTCDAGGAHTPTSAAVPNAFSAEGKFAKNGLCQMYRELQIFKACPYILR